MISRLRAYLRTIHRFDGMRRASEVELAAIRNRRPTVAPWERARALDTEIRQLDARVVTARREVAELTEVAS